MSLRHQVIKLAAAMPKGSPERLALLAAIREARAPKEYNDAKILSLKLEKMAAQIGRYDYDKKRVVGALEDARMNLMRLSATYAGSPDFWGDESEAADERSVLIDDIESSLAAFRRKAAEVESLARSLQAIEKLSLEAHKLVRGMR